MKTPDGEDGILININLVLMRSISQPLNQGTGSAICNAYIKDPNNTQLAYYENIYSGNGGTSNETYQLFATGYTYDTIIVEGHISATGKWTGGFSNSQKCYGLATLSGTISYIISE